MSGEARKSRENQSDACRATSIGREKGSGSRGPGQSEMAVPPVSIG